MFPLSCAAARPRSAVRQRRAAVFNSAQHVATLKLISFLRATAICYSAYMPRQFRLSVRLSVCPTGLGPDRYMTISVHTTSVH